MVVLQPKVNKKENEIKANDYEATKIKLHWSEMHVIHNIEGHR